MRRRDGHTLIELLVALALLGILVAMALPPVGRWRDQAAVRAARDELAGGIAWTRVAAVSRGGAVFVVDPATARFWTRTSEGEDSPVIDLHARHGVQLETGAARVMLRYDALGIGRAASRTFTVRRGAATGGVTVSAYGRYRRW